MFSKFSLTLCAVYALACSTVMATEPTVPPAEKPGAPRPMHNNFMRGERHFMRNPEVLTARLVMKEIKAYQADKSDKNFAALEKALHEAIKADTAKRKAELERQLAYLEKDQAERANKLLQAVKSGEFKLPPPRPPRSRMRGPGSRNDHRQLPQPPQK